MRSRETSRSDAGRGARRRLRVLERYDYRCVYCGEVYEEAELTVDHVEPRVKGGDHSRGNLVACCVACNREKGGRTAWAFLADKPARRANFLRHADVWPRLREAVLEAADDASGSRP